MPKPLVFLDTETTGLYPGDAEMLSMSMLDQQGNTLLKHPKTGEPVYEMKVKPKHIETASPFALDVNGYPAWDRFLDQEMMHPDGSTTTRRDHYVGENPKKPAWKKNKQHQKELQAQWREFALHPSDEEKKARETDDWADALPFEDWADQVGQVLDQHRVVGQNPFFDQRFIDFELDRSGNDSRVGEDIIDTQVLSWLAGMQHQSLGNTTEQLGIDLEHAHTAYADTEATRQVFERLRDPKALGEIRRNQDPEKGRTRSVLFVGLETSGDDPKTDTITSMAIMDPQGRTLMDAKLDSDEAKSKAIQTFTHLMEGHAMGTDAPERDMAFIKALAKSHGRKDHKGRPVDGWRGGRRFFHTPSLAQIFGAQPTHDESSSALEKAQSQVGQFHQVAEESYGPEGEHKTEIKELEDWLGGRTFKHPLPKGHDSRRKDFLTWSGLKSLADSENPEAARAAQQMIQGLWRQFQRTQAQAQQHRQARKVASMWMLEILRNSF
jgi:DNA polymerase III epsilon subunit-like protein